MLMVLSKEWKEVLASLKNSKILVLKDLADQTESWFPFTRTKAYNYFGNWKSTIVFQNKDGKRLDEKNRVVNCVETLTFLSSEVKKLSFAHCIVEKRETSSKKVKDAENKASVVKESENETSVKYVKDKTLFLKQGNNVQLGKLIVYKSGNFETYNFQIKNNKVCKFKADKAKEF